MLHDLTTGLVPGFWFTLYFTDNGNVELYVDDIGNGTSLRGQGVYTARWVPGLIAYRIEFSYSLAGRNFVTLLDLFSVSNTVLDFSSVSNTPGLRMIRYFDASGVETEREIINGSPGMSNMSNIVMYCQADGHNRNTRQARYSFFCPDQTGQNTVITNQLRVNWARPGQVFRQRNIQTIGNPNGIAERNDFGMFIEDRSNANRVTFDFNTQPTLATYGSSYGFPDLDLFSDRNVFHATVYPNGRNGLPELMIDEFDADRDRCYVSP